MAFIFSYSLHNQSSLLSPYLSNQFQSGLFQTTMWLKPRYIAVKFVINISAYFCFVTRMRQTFELQIKLLREIVFQVSAQNRSSNFGNNIDLRSASSAHIRISQEMQLNSAWSTLCSGRSRVALFNHSKCSIMYVNEKIQTNS